MQMSWTTSTCTSSRRQLNSFDGRRWRQFDGQHRAPQRRRIHTQCGMWTRIWWRGLKTHRRNRCACPRRLTTSRSQAGREGLGRSSPLEGVCYCWVAVGRLARTAARSPDLFAGVWHILYSLLPCCYFPTCICLAHDCSRQVQYTLLFLRSLVRQHSYLNITHN